jgi:hypothetical protein
MVWPYLAQCKHPEILIIGQFNLGNVLGMYQVKTDSFVQTMETSI